MSQFPAHRPLCECGTVVCDGVTLPHEAWLIAGAGQGDERQFAVHPDHLDALKAVRAVGEVVDHDGWLDVEIR